MGEGFIGSVWQGKLRSSEMKQEQPGVASATYQEEEGLDLHPMNWEDRENVC